MSALFKRCAVMPLRVPQSGHTKIHDAAFSGCHATRLCSLACWCLCLLLSVGSALLVSVLLSGWYCCFSERPLRNGGTAAATAGCCAEPMMPRQLSA